MKEIKLDDIDWKILSLLNNNSRITLVDIAEKVKLKEPQITIKPIRTIADEAIKFVKENPDSSLVAKEFRNPRTKELESGPRLFQRIGESIRNG